MTKNNVCSALYFRNHVQSFLLPKIRGGVLIFEIWTKRGVMKKMLEIEELVERGHSLRKGGFQIVLSVFL